MLEIADPSLRVNGEMFAGGGLSTPLAAQVLVPHWNHPPYLPLFPLHGGGARDADR